MSTYVPEFRDDPSVRATRMSVAEKLAEELESWHDAGVLPGMIANMGGGFSYGLALGMIPVLFQFNQYLGDCSRYTSETACNALTDTGCTWIASQSICGYPDWKTVNCSHFFSQDSCKDAPSGDCYWKFQEETCEHLAGWDSNQQGLLAGIQIVGSMVASLVAGPMANKLGRKLSISVAGFFLLLACTLTCVGWQLKENYPLLLLGQFTIGFAVGCISVVCPMYVGEVIKGTRMKNNVGVLFQSSVTVGIAVDGAMALILDPRNDTGGDEEHHLQARVQWILIAQWIVAAFVTTSGFFLPESPLWLKQRFFRTTKAGKTQQNDPHGGINNINEESERRPLLQNSNNNNNTNDYGQNISSTSIDDDAAAEHKKIIKGQELEFPSEVDETFRKHDLEQQYYSAIADSAPRPRNAPGRIKTGAAGEFDGAVDGLQRTSTAGRPNRKVVVFHDATNNNNYNNNNTNATPPPDQIVYPNTPGGSTVPSPAVPKNKATLRKSNNTRDSGTAVSTDFGFSRDDLPTILDESVAGKDEEASPTTPNPAASSSVPSHHDESSNFRDLCNRNMLLPLFIGVMLSVSLQFSGINAVILYAPNITAKLGLSPFLGNFCIAIWNLLCCFIPIYLVQHFSCRRIFIFCTALAGFAMTLGGVAVLPGIFEPESKMQKGLGISGILLFILSFEAGIGPCFYVLAQDVFPKQVRSLGTSFVVYCAFLTNLAVNFGFPVATTALSGGPSGNQNKGMSMMFLIFAGCAFLAAGSLKCTMPKSVAETMEEERREREKEEIIEEIDAKEEQEE